jgi:hypothetical protein
MRLVIALFCVAAVSRFFFAAEIQRSAEATQRLPLIYWPQGVETASALKQAGVEQIATPPDKTEAWRKAGFKAVAITQDDLSRREKLLVPRLAGRANVASATRRPWIDANGWRFIRNPAGKFYYDLPAGKAPLALAEAFAYGADAILKIDPADLEETGKMFGFLLRLTPQNLPLIADIAVVDDGSPALGEVMNLLVRRNLLFKPVSSPSSQFALNIKLGSKDYPESEAADPSAFAQKIRRQLTDEKRTVRIYGSEIVICRLTGDGSRLRLHLLNYSGRDVEGLRVRLLGAYGKVEANVYGPNVYGQDKTSLEHFVVADGATEFSLRQMGLYAAIDLL